jgi:hypothetical protein
MTSGKRKPAFAVPRQSVRRWKESIHIVAGFALAFEARLELSGVFVLMAIRASPEHGTVVGVFSAAFMTLRARNGRMPARQRILRRCVPGDVECGWFETFDFMTSGTVAAIR